MKNNKELTECKEKFHTKFRRKISFIFNKTKDCKIEEINSVNQKEVKVGADEIGMNNTNLNSDFEILSNFVNKRASIDEIDLETEKRLIKLCTMKSKKLEKKLDDLDNQIINMNIALNTMKKSLN